MNDLDELTRYLQQRAAGANLGHRPVGIITRAGSRRRQRQRALTSGGVLAVGALSAVATVQLTRDGDRGRRISTDVNPPVSVDAPTTSTPGGTPTTAAATTSIAASPALVPSPLVWNEVTIGSAESITMLDQFFEPATTGRTADGGYYQSSTTPGRAGGRTSMLYRSDDGVTWRAAPEQLFEGRLAPLAIDGDRLYAISTTAAGSPDVAARADHVAVSSDDGATWETRPLPYDIGAIRDLPAVDHAVIWQRRIAVGPGGVVIAARVQATISAERVAEVLHAAPGAIGYDQNGWVEYEITPVDCDTLRGDASDSRPDVRGAMTESGCVVWGDVVRRITPEDLGLTADAAAALTGQLVLFHSSDGETFTRIEPPEQLRAGGIDGIQLLAADGRFVLAALAPDPITVAEVASALIFTSADGVSWQPLPGIPGSACRVRPTMVTGTVVAAIDPCDGTPPRILTLVGESWVDSQLFDGDATVLATSIDAGPAGIAVAVETGRMVSTEASSGPPPVDATSRRSYLAYSRDGLTWSVSDLGEVVDDIASQTITAVRVTDTNVLLSMRRRLDAVAPTDPLPDVTVLVGTPG